MNLNKKIYFITAGAAAVILSFIIIFRDVPDKTPEIIHSEVTMASETFTAANTHTIPSLYESITCITTADASQVYVTISQAYSDRININTAGVDELTKLKGIGEKKAQRIIEYREANNGFASTEDIMKVNGIGEKTYASIKEKLCV